jgi:hypothetical protein
LLIGFDRNANLLEILYNVIRKRWFNTPQLVAAETTVILLSFG